MPGLPVVQRDELFAEGIVPVTPLKEDSRVPVLRHPGLAETDESPGCFPSLLWDSN